MFLNGLIIHQLYLHVPGIKIARKDYKYVTRLVTNRQSQHDTFVEPAKCSSIYRGTEDINHGEEPAQLSG